MHIEWSFGMLVARWSILWRPLQFALRTNIRTVQIAILLHNYCIEKCDTNVDGLVNAGELDKITSFAKSLMVSSSSRNTFGLTGRHASSTRSRQRDYLVEIIKELVIE